MKNKRISSALLTTIALTFVSFVAMAQVVERPRPAGWENLVPGGRFMVTGGEGERP